MPRNNAVISACRDCTQFGLVICYPNCLIKNPNEAHSLLHVSNLSEMTCSDRLGGRQNEVNDERGRKAVIKAWPSQYRKAGKKEKGRILDELVALTGYNRGYMVGLMRWDGKVVRTGRRVRLVGNLRKKAKRTGQRLYDETVQHGLKEIWAI